MGIVPPKFLKIDKIGSKKFSRAFSNSQRRFPPSPSRLPDTPIAPFSQLSNQVRLFIDELLNRDMDAIEQLTDTIQSNIDSTNFYYSDTNVARNNDAQIQRMTELIGEDISERRRYEQSAHLLNAINNGHEPPIHNTDAWLSLKNDLDNSQVEGIETLKEYVQNVYDTNIRDQWVRSHPINFSANLPEDRSRDNSSVEFSEYDSDSISNSDSDSDNYLSADTHQDESDYISEFDSDEYQSADTDQDQSSSSSETYSDDNPPGADGGLNHNNNQSDDNFESNSDIGQYSDNHDFNQYNDSNGSNPDLNQSADNTESKASPDKKPLTEDAMDISDTLHLFYDESSVKNQSTIDYVLQRQQEQMPDIMDSDGGE